MGRRRALILVLTSLILFIVGCAGSSFLRRPLPDASFDSLVSGLQEHALRLRTYEGRGQMMAVSSDGGFRGTVRIVGKLPDSLWIKVEGPLGIDVMRGVFGRGRVVLYYPRENVAYEGSMCRMQESGFIPMNLPDQDVMLGMLGLVVPETILDGAVLSDSSDSRRYYFRLEGDEEVWIEPKGPVVARWEKRNGEGELLWDWEGEDFRKRGGVRLPRVVRMTRYQPRERVTFFYEAIKVNGRMRSGWFDIQIPEGVETIAL